MDENKEKVAEVVRTGCQGVLSVLVAVYNSASYLRRCLDSLVGQTYPWLDIICVDDCSEDNSLDILLEYAANDSRVQVLHLDQNVGQAVARNRALELSRGDWVTMVDSDDWLEEDAISKVIEALSVDEEIDAAVFQLMKYYDDSNCHVYPIASVLKTGKIISGMEAFEWSLDWQLHGLYVVRASIHHQYPYDTSSRLYSDDNTTRLHYLHSRKVIITEAKYFYRQHDSSATHAVSVNRFLYLEANISMKKQLIEEVRLHQLDGFERVLDRYETIRWLNIVNACWYYFLHKSHFTDDERLQANGTIKKAFDTIERQRIAPTTRHKFGFYPFKSYSLFRFVGNIYFTLRCLLGRK